MQSRFSHCVIAFLLTTTFFWCFRRAAIEKTLLEARKEILAEEEYQRLQQYVDENNLDSGKIRRMFMADDTPKSDFLIIAVICAFVIVPYSVSLALIRRIADHLLDSDTRRSVTAPPEEDFR